MSKQLITIGVIFLLGGIYSLSLINEPTKAAPDGSINISYPNEGYWWEEDTMSIYWSSSDAGPYVKIELFEGGYFASTITGNTSNDGDYSWKIPDISTSYNYRLKITSLANSNIYDYSGYITIYNRYITINSPSGGETWYKDEICNIEWSSEYAGSYIDIELYKDGLYYQTIESNHYLYSNWYDWVIPSNLPISSNYEIKITSRSFNNVYDFSGSFTIDEKSITITSPGEDEIWYIGETYTIKWDSKNAGNYVEIAYRYGPGPAYYYYTITSNTSNDGNYSWTIPLTLTNRSDYKIFIESLSDSSIDDLSEKFSIDERFISIISPTYKIIWYKGDEYEIKWEAKNIGEDVEITLYQNGLPVATIVSNTDNDGNYSWSIPNNISSSSSSKIKVKSTTYSDTYGISDYFTIDDRSITVHDPKEDTWHLGGTYWVTWDSEGAGNYVTIELYENGVYASTIASKTENDGSYQWTIPSNLSPGSSYTIQITSTTYDNVTASSSGYIAIEESLLQQWSGSIILIMACVIIAVVGLFMFRKLKKKNVPSPEENEPEEPKEKTTLQKIEVKKLSEDEYERIWEKRRP